MAASPEENSQLEDSNVIFSFLQLTVYAPQTVKLKIRHCNQFIHPFLDFTCIILRFCVGVRPRTTSDVVPG